MEPLDLKQFDPLIQAPVRLAILSILMSIVEADFSYLKKMTKTSDGNLSTHLSKLEAAKYVSIKKTFVNKKPKSICKITKPGMQAFTQHIQRLEQLVNIGKK